MPTTASPPSMSPLHTDPTAACWPPIPPRCAALRRYAVWVFPAISTWPPGSRAGGVDRSRSLALFDLQSLGAKNCMSWRDGESSSAESLLSYAWPAEVIEPFPTPTQRCPLLSTTGAAPPIQIAPCDSSAASSTAKSTGVPPVSPTATSQPRYVSQTTSLPP